jgi:tetratricopeptide (TPR) repeat protein
MTTATVTTRSRPRLSFRTLIFAACAVLLAWLVVSRSLAAYLADAAPNMALWLSPGQPDALVNLADRSLNAFSTTFGSPSDGTDQGLDQQKAADLEQPNTSPAPEDGSSPRQDAPDKAPLAKGSANIQPLADAFAAIDSNRSVDLAELRAQTIAALIRAPLNARALRILGQIEATGNDNAGAARLMTESARLSLHQSIAVYWLMRKNAQDGDYKAAIAYADDLLRTNPDLARYAVPVLAHFADDKKSAAAVEAVLNTDPPWRNLFFRLLPESVADARTPLKLLVALKSSPTPPAAEDIGRYLDLLIAHKYYDLAYYTWLQFIPLQELREAGLLFNGSFELAPSGMPFDWSIKQGSGVTIDIVPRPDAPGQHALSVDFLYGRVDFHSVYELVVLPPGVYRFAVQYSGKIVGPRGMKWRVTCANDSHARLGESQMISDTGSAWKRSEFAFTVPPADCRAQYVQLDLDARMASEQIVSGSLLFDDLSISHAAAAPGTTGAIVPAGAPQATATANAPQGIK